jgi:predicted RNA-binding protein with TRAM domain
MSQTKRILKEIASGEDYQALTAAIERVDYEAMFASYMRISKLLSERKGRIEDGIADLPLQNKDESRGKFLHAFELATERMLPLWHQLNSELMKGKVMEGEVFSFGKKGDPLVKRPEGTTVVLPGSKLEKGEKVRFRVIQEAEKLNFGKVFDLNPQSFYLLITQEAREKIRNSLALIGDRLKTSPEPLNEGPPSELGELLQKLEEVKRLSSTLQAEERERVAAQVTRYRKRLLQGASIRLVFDFISRQEEKGIENFYQDSHEEKGKALLALGLFRRHTYEAARERLFLGDKPKGYAEILNEMKDKVDSMDSAIELLDAKSALDEVYPKAKGYFEKMDHLFENLTQRAKQVADVLSNKGVVDPEEIYQAIKNAFPEEILFFELQKVFRSSKELLSLRGAVNELNRWLRNQENISSEAAFRPYLHHKVLQAFGSQMPKAEEETGAIPAQKDSSRQERQIPPSP